MTVGMEISPRVMVQQFGTILCGVIALIVGKTLMLAAIARPFGLSTIAAVRAGMYLGPGGEFAFVALGDAIAKNILSIDMGNLIFAVTAISMAVTPYLAALGMKAGEAFGGNTSKADSKDLQPNEAETEDLKGHVIICGFGRIGQIVAQVLSERLIPFVAADVNAERVQAGKKVRLP